MQTLLSSIFVFGLLILAHEIGHFVAARLAGIKVLELAIGFGPKIISWRRRETDYSLRLFPLGGFCRMLGEAPEEAAEPGNFQQKPLLHRAAVLAGGATMNLLLAFLLFFVIAFFLVGTAQLDSTRLGYIVPDSPAEEAGLQPGDSIVSIDGQPVENWRDIVAATEPRAERETRIVFMRDGEYREVKLTPQVNPQTGKGFIGVGVSVRKYDMVGSLLFSVNSYKAVLNTIVQMVKGKAPLDVAGPLGIILTVGEVAATGMANLLGLSAVISISLGIMNLLPIPALDGGRLLFLLIEAIRGRPLDPEKEGFVHFIGFALLILLILLVTYNDLLRWDIIPR